MRTVLLALALTGCWQASGNRAVQVDETNQLARDIETRYHQPARVMLTAGGEMNVYLTPTGGIDRKFSPNDCNDYAQRIARFAMNHYARPASVDYVWVHVILTQPGSSGRVECEGDGPHGALPPDNETPSILTGAGARPH
jgi:hypothetical protein